MGENILKIGNAIIWVIAYFGIMIFNTFLNVAVWRKEFPIYSEWINIIVIMLCAVGFIYEHKHYDRAKNLPIADTHKNYRGKALCRHRKNRNGKGNIV
ncbi:MAG: hypothetical protein K2O91_24900 [Lachnospiraceae bacterium]|nr:hypothetical protein [Lachnospiraceae bacterium]